MIISPVPLQWGVWPTIHCNPLHFCQPCRFSPVWLSALMRSRLQSVAVRSSMVSGETQDNEWIIKGSPVERKEFWYLFATAHATYIQSLFLLASPGIPGSGDPWMPHANERHCCGFNANQYCANIHLRRWLHDETGAVPTWNARSHTWSGELLGKCAAMHECSSRCTQVITENNLENKYNGQQINSVSTTITTFGSGCAEERIPFQQSSKFRFFFFLVKLLHSWSKC